MYRQDVPDAQGQRPAPRPYERFVHRLSGVATGGRLGGSAFLDAPVLSQINENWREDVIFERSRVFLQSVRGDIAWVVENNPNAATPIEQMTYDVWGAPGLLSHGADVDDDGDAGTGLHPDGGVTIDDLTVYLDLFENGDPAADIDNGYGLGVRDGGVGIDDLLLYLAWFEVGVIGSVDDNRFLYRGYLWDPVLQMYHVRHRVYDPRAHVFLQPDPLGVAAGRNIYAYCDGDPVNCYDPYGLWGEQLAQDLVYSDSLLSRITGTAFGTTGTVLEHVAGAMFESLRMTQDLGYAAERVYDGARSTIKRSIAAAENRADGTGPGVGDYVVSFAREVTGAQSVANAAAGFDVAENRELTESERFDQAGAGAQSMLLTFVTLAGPAAGPAAGAVGKLAAAEPPPLPGKIPTGGLMTADAPKGGRLGSAATRQHVADVAEELDRRGWKVTHGGGTPEEYIPGTGPGTRGSAYPDITASKNGRTLRVNTIDTLADGVTPTIREARNAARIRSLCPGDHLLLIPKPAQ